MSLTARDLVAIVRFQSGGAASPRPPRLQRKPRLPNEAAWDTPPYLILILILIVYLILPPTTSPQPFLPPPAGGFKLTLMNASVSHPSGREFSLPWGPFCRKHRLRHLAVFGSCAQGTPRADSDMDLLATLEDPSRVAPQDLFEMAGEAEELVGRRVDFVLRDRLEASKNGRARDHILATALTLYGG